MVNRKILVALSGKTFLWDFHESGSLLLTSSLSGTLYLSLLHLACNHRNGSKGLNAFDTRESWGNFLSLSNLMTVQDLKFLVILTEQC